MHLNFKDNKHCLKDEQVEKDVQANGSQKQASATVQISDFSPERVTSYGLRDIKGTFIHCV